ncbi:unnamed protein product [Miscanthus lutarioriparius]|uniref:Uncharacterized protein n=1 Tax=Miscanthus lutarioriparius TaxID=422564 RepID=A0A811S4P3_9POAL|nr:unnamed protein product [Miscanthus lutarioriparius]
MAPAFTILLPAATSAAATASRLPSAAAAGAASTFVRLPHHPTGWAGASVAAPLTAARRRAPGVAYATAATEKSIYDYTVKVACFFCSVEIEISARHGHLNFFTIACCAGPNGWRCAVTC